MRKIKKGFFYKIKFTESYTSLILGAIVVLIVGILFISFAKINKSSQTSSTKDSLKTEEQKSNTSSTYTINPGDDLWSISENVYQDGYKWIEIAKLNKLENPALIHAGNKLIIPTISPPVSTENAEALTAITQNNSIAGNTYAIVPGDNLWNIAVRAYGDGFRWVELAKVNNLTNPDLIFSGNVLKIPR